MRWVFKNFKFYHHFYDGIIEANHAITSVLTDLEHDFPVLVFQIKPFQY